MRASVQHGDGVVQRAAATIGRRGVAFDATDENVQRGRHVRGELAQHRVVPREERRTDEQVLGRVAADREFGKYGELRAELLRLARRRDDARRVARKVADRGVDLAERDLHRFSALRAAT